MKKKICLLLCCAAVCAALFSSCGLVSGAPGKSAYEIAVDNGFRGSEEAWLQSLHAPAGETPAAGGDLYLSGVSLSAEELYETAKKYGYEGSFLEFVSQYVGAGGEDGMEQTIAACILSAVNVKASFVGTRYQLGFGGYRTVEYEYAMAGSGVIYRLDKSTGSAYIVTNYHVVFDSDSNTDDGVSEDVRVYLYGEGTESDGIPASFVGGSAYYDIAVLRVEGSDVLKNSAARAAVFADSDEVTVGNRAVAIGNPEAEGISATAGIVSVDSEYITMRTLDETATRSVRVIRVDTPINSGNSGGGLFNAAGEVIGIVNAKYNSASVDNIGYAIPANVAVAVAENVLENGTGKGGITRCLLGVTLETAESHAEYDADQRITRVVEKVRVATVEEGSRADGLLQPGDVVRAVTQSGVRREISRQFILTDLLLGCRVGDELTLEIERNGEAVTLTAVLEEGDIIEMP